MSTTVSTMGSSLRDRIAAKRKDIKQKSGLRADVIRLPMGKHKFRILPAHADLGPDADFWVDFGQHYVKDEANKTKAVYVCVDRTFGRPCAVCAALDSAMRGAVDDAQVKAIEDSLCKRAEILVYALHLNSSDKANVPQILQLTPTTFGQILDLVEEYGDIHSLTDGTDLIIERSGTGLNTEYSVMPAKTSLPVAASVMAGVTNLAEFVQQESEDGQRKAINQVNAIIGVIEPADYAPKAIAAASPAKRLEKPVIEDVDMEVATPTRKAAAPAAATVVDDAPFTTDLDELMAIDEELAATGTDGAAVTTKTTTPSVDDLDALLGELDAL